jgi:adenosine deaminase CECR1
MNYEFYQVMVGAPTMSLYSWKQLARWSIEYSCLDEDQKKRGLGILARTWQNFCQTVVEVCDDKDTGLMNGDAIDEDKAKVFFSQKTVWHKKDNPELS